MAVGIGETGQQREFVEVRYGFSELSPVVAVRAPLVDGAELGSRPVQVRKTNPYASFGGQVLIVIMIERIAQKQDGALYGGGAGAAIREQRRFLQRCAIDNETVAIRHAQGHATRRFGEGAMLLQGGHATSTLFMA